MVQILGDGDHRGAAGFRRVPLAAEIHRGWAHRRRGEGLRLSAIQHRARAPFVQPLPGDRFYVRLLCEAGDLAAVRCHFADKYAAGVEGTLSLSRETTDGVSDYWSAVLPVPTSRLRYFFELTDNSGETRFFNEHGFHDKRPARKHHAGHFFYPYDLPIDRFAVPSWIAGRTFYLVFPDRFAN
ncbi:MAG: hypothetical protein E6I54_09035, partial [Chloroflexi bacterium]